MLMIKKIYNSFFTYILYRNSTPLGRWSQCGEKRNVEDVIAIKIKQKEDRLFLIKNNIDPYNKYKIQNSSNYEEDPYLCYYLFDH